MNASLLTASTTSLAGGVVYANNLGQSTAIGPDGINGTGWTLNVHNLANTSSTVIHDGSITSTVAGLGSTNINGGFVTVNGTYTGNVAGLNAGNAGLFVSGGGIVSNGLIVNGGSVTNGGATVNGGFTANGGSILNGGATVNGATKLNGNVSVSSGSTVDMGGNRVENVGTPVFGTDATNKAYVDKGLNKAYEGTAIALAISQPVFLPGQTFAMRGGWGSFEGQNAFGVSAAGVIAHNTFGYGSTVSLDAGIGAGNSSVAGKAGVTVGFGGGSAPLK